ncbi:uncharacterized protein Z519_06798 [Cladophialophora bantiana CBS 173.52]|uniref:GYF domain-containing protein n=1 Tax=Cladophialophora bantiana (strain ATCC 10958 / CBS 173.52 / CDC B-1940 / NIH 8579) TaxID=1442370 RepID=A0A0D2I819_CLAB1|nr:uncharacterized protein Z519_06798 [Cladophialophora bantiana CBS 173.52]KIW92949.1 hypothetical protein Z519_06798 [Cladophialophora bantiana CBS 173.52]
MAYNYPPFKRAAEDYVRTTHSDDGSYGQPTKKPRFDVRNPSALAPDALEEDAILEADVIGTRGQQVKRGAVNIDGYESDSDNDNFEARADRKAKANARAEKSKVEDENDMFADLEEDFRDDSDGGAGRRSGKKKAVRFIDEDEIEGQIQSSKSGGHVSADFSLNGRGKGKAKEEDDEVESSSESEVDDETRASTGELDPELGAGSKKSHAPKLDAFNMRTEQEEGRFDDQGNYVRKAADPDAIHDIWLEGMSKKEMKRAREAADKREEERRKRDLEEDAKSTGDVLAELISLLERGETVLEALARLAKAKDKKPKRQPRSKHKKQNGELEGHPTADETAEKARKAKVEKISGAAAILLGRGQAEVYDTERELLIRQYRRETGNDWNNPPQPEDLDSHAHADDSMVQLWEYRWTDARDGGAINGPFDGPTMKQWNDAGYFGEGVEFRKKHGGGGDWTRVAEFA